MALIICFIAPSKSGKTTAARCLGKLLTSHYNYTGPITYLSFATIYKDIAKLVGFDILKKDTVDARLGIRPRDFLRALGDFFRIQLPTKHTDWLKDSSMTFSTFYLMEHIRKLEGIIVIDDLRYLEEYSAMKQMGAKMAYIYRRDVVVDFSHASETELFQIVRTARPKTIENNSNIDSLKQNILQWLKDEEIEDYINDKDHSFLSH